MAAKKAVRKRAMRKPASKTARKSAAKKARSTTRQKKVATKSPGTKKRLQPTGATPKRTASSGRMKALGRPKLAGTAELEVVFRKDREAREIFEFLGVKTIKELEALSPDEILDRLMSPMIHTVGRIRKSLAINNRSLAGDQKFAISFQKQIS